MSFTKVNRLHTVFTVYTYRHRLLLRIAARSLHMHLTTAYESKHAQLIIFYAHCSCYERNVEGLFIESIKEYIF